MNSIGACLFTAAYVKFTIVLHTIVLASAFSMLLSAANCPAQELSPQEKLARFKQLDKEAEAAVQERRSLQAVALYKQAICLVPNSARAFYGLGVAEAAAGDFAKARETLRTADRLQPTTIAPLLMQARVNLSLNDVDSLKGDLREAAQRFPHEAQMHQELARLLAAKNLFVLALGEALRSQQAGAADLSSKVQLAVLENTVGAYEDAIQNGVTVYENRTLPNEVRASAAGIAGLSFESLGNSEQAIHYLREAIQLDPSRDNSYLGLADLFEQSQKYTDALNVLQQARLNIPNSPAILLPLGADLIRTEHYQEGVALLRELLRHAPDAIDAYISIADASRKMGKPEQEVAALRDLEHYQPNYPMLHVLIARALLSEDHPDYQNVLAELTQAESISPSDADVFYLRGKIYFTLGRYQDAMAALRHSIELRPMEASPYYQLARVYQKLGQSAMAHEQFERVKYLESVSPK